MPPGASDPRQTPAMRQFSAFKRRHPGCLLFFRMGDFYEMFDEDAVAASKSLGLTLTRRQNDIPMAGIPYHQKDVYLRRALEAGFRVAVVDQVQDPRDAKGVVERAVTGVVTPGTLIEDALLRDERAVVLACVCFASDEHAGVAAAELSTGSCVVFDGSPDRIVDELARLGVSEVLYAEAPVVRGRGTPEGGVPGRVASLLSALGVAGTPRPGRAFSREGALALIGRQYGVATVAGFGLSAEEPATGALGALIEYLRETQAVDEPVPGSEASRGSGAATAGGLVSGERTLSHLSAPRRLRAEEHCELDAVSLRALEVERTLRSGRAGAVDTSEGSLLGVFLASPVGSRSALRTAMGKRLIREWLCRPLARAEAIRHRQDAVSVLLSDVTLAERVGEGLDEVQDVARIGGRLALGRATPRDLVALGRSVGVLGRLVDATSSTAALASQHARLSGSLSALSGVGSQIVEQCVASPPAHLREGGLIRDGVDGVLDEARGLERDAGAWLSAYQERLSGEHDLPGMKVGYNKVFGYYIELPAAQARRAPGVFERRQTLKNAERYSTPALREFEGKVTTATTRAVEREQDLFRRMCAAAARQIEAIRSFGEAAAELDVLLALAEKARARGWVRPEVTDEPELRIEGGRHPVLDELLGHGFVPNDLELGGGPEGGRPSLALITGPNMAGKSTFIRQTALLVVLASIGSWIPATSATIGTADRIFTRVGADDALHRGQSTFMVEMTETATILNNATARSLVVLDEIGRGTSTLDGLSLAWSITERLAGLLGEEGAGGSPPRCLFATHYHEITRLADEQPARIRNLHVRVREWTAPSGQREIIFEHTIAPGRADRSYGVHVARLAGLPGSVTRRAEHLLESLSVEHGAGVGAGAELIARAAAEAPSGGQLGLFTEYVPHPAVEALRVLELDRLSPMDAFDALRRLRAMVGGDGRR